jgi:hypothetical protein
VLPFPGTLHNVASIEEFLVSSSVTLIAYMQSKAISAVLLNYAFCSVLPVVTNNVSADTICT